MVVVVMAAVAEERGGTNKEEGADGPRHKVRVSAWRQILAGRCAVLGLAQSRARVCGYFWASVEPTIRFQAC